MKLQGVTDYNRDHLAGLIEANIIDFFNWGCVQAGGFVDEPVATPGTPDPYSKETLTPVHKEGVVDGAVWQADRPAWCYEEGLEDGVAPLIPQGVYVNGTYYPTGTTGPFAHYLDFTRGLVVFTTPLLQSSIVQVAHSWRRAHFVPVGFPWFQSVVLDGFLTERNGGVIGVLEENRLQTPLVAVQVVSVDGMSGYELGGSSRWTRPDVILYVLASTKDDVDRISGLIVNQYNNRIAMYDLNARRQADDFPLDSRGSRRPGKSSYPQALSLYYYNSMRFEDVSSYVQDTHTGLFMSICRTRLELVVGST